MKLRSGQTAESTAATYLEGQGFRIVERNWKNRLCEIDIVASKDDTLYFIEVKYRQRSAQGDGLEYITSAKLKQMHFAAEQYLMTQEWNGDTSLAAIALSGPNYRVSQFIESVEV